MSIRSVLLGGAFGAALAFPALAADLSYAVKAPVAVAPAFSWTGFYAGGNFGYGWGDGSADWNNYLGYYYPGWSQEIGGSDDPQGWYAGFQLGYNYQFANNVVLGVEADAEFGSLRDTMAYHTYDASTGTVQEDVGVLKTRIQQFGTVRGRLGYAAGRLMPYATGGLAWGNVTVSETWSAYSNGVYQPGLSGTASASETLWGWTAGGGVEFAFVDQWTIKGEYLYTDLGDISWDGDANTNINMKLQTLKLGINYRF